MTGLYKPSLLNGKLDWGVSNHNMMKAAFIIMTDCKNKQRKLNGKAWQSIQLNCFFMRCALLYTEDEYIQFLIKWHGKKLN